MKRSVLLLLMSAIVISGFSVVYRDPWSMGPDYNHQSGQQLNSGVEKTISKRDAKDTSGSISEELTVGANEEVLDGMDSSMESSSAEEQKLIMDSQEAAEPAVRRRRSDVRYRNLYLLATICPDADFSDLEDGSTINSVIEIRDMYAICEGLPKIRS